MNLQVQLPSTITGESPLSHIDPRLRSLHEELDNLNKRLQVRAHDNVCRRAQPWRR